MIGRLAFGFIAIAGIGLTISFVQFTDQPRIRYNSLPCFYKLAYGTEGPVDIVVMGSSRTKQGVSAEVMSQQVKIDGNDSVVLNLARSWRGNGQLYRQIRDVNESLGIRSAIVIELSTFAQKGNATTRYYYGYYPNYESVVPSKDFLEDFDSKPREPVYSKVRDIIGQYITKIDVHISLALANKNLSKLNGIKLKTQSASCFARDNKLRPSALLRVEERISKAGKTWPEYKPRKWDLDFINEDRPAHYIKRIRDFAHENGLAFILMLVPRYWETPAPLSFIEEVQARFGVSLIQPPNDVRKSMYDGGYTDVTHMAESGRIVFSTWLGNEVRKHLVISR